MNQMVSQQKDETLIGVLANSFYPGAERNSILMVIDYCRAAQLDPMQKPVHIVPMWDSKLGRMRDVVMPGISLYRINASRSGSYGGVSEPEFGEDVTEEIGGQQVTYPKWCRVTVSRIAGDKIITFTAREFWKENYAVKGGKEKSIAPNAMWAKRPYAQLAKCAEAQALRKAFPESCAGNTAEEMEGKAIQIDDAQQHNEGLEVVLISDAQAAEIRASLQACGKEEDALCKKCRVAAIEEIEASRFDAVMRLIQGVANAPA